MELKTRGIYLVANKKSEFQCENLVKSIRNFGCQLPITIIHFGGEKITSNYLLENVTHKIENEFNTEAIKLIDSLAKLLICPRGFLLRFLAYFGEYDEFIYSDNDILAFANWDLFFERLDSYQVIHADEEYTTEGVFNFDKPLEIKKIFGESALERCITVGHFCSKKSDSFVQVLYQALNWMENNHGIAKLHDQALVITAILLGEIKVLNLCKTESYLSSWAGDYNSALDLITKLRQNSKLSHLHYSGKTLQGLDNIDDLWTSYLAPKTRLKYYLKITLKYFLGYFIFQKYSEKIRRRLANII